MQLVINSSEYEYEIKALLKAFYPNEDSDIKVNIELEEEKIGISFCKNEIPILQKNGIVNSTKKRDYKNTLKRYLYQVLHEVTGLSLPWGTLTGVRPVKLAMELIESNIGLEEAKKFMKEQYFCTEEKAALGLEIAQKEFDLLKSIDYQKGYSLYIGIAFCPTTCVYCSFTSYSLKQWGNYVEPYLHALFQEMEYAKDMFPNKKLNTIYIGGGTPTTLNEDQLDLLLSKVKNTFPMEHVKEFTVEAGRPDSITREKLKVLKKHAVTRISINPQTMNQKTLDLIGRKHTVEQVRDAFFLAREEGHDNINMDFIMGLTNETCDDVRHTFRQIKDLKPDSITVHSLVLKRAASLNTNRETGCALEADWVDDMLKMGALFAREEGLFPYYLYRQKNATGSGILSRENVGYAKLGKEGLYNILIMEEKQSILALGAGGATKIVFPEEGRIERIENVKSVKDYVERIDEMIQRKRTFCETQLHSCET